jgi:putative transposase
MNQIEIWFGILAKKVMRCGKFLCTDDLKEQILQFIDYFNATMAKPFIWTYEGKVLCHWPAGGNLCVEVLAS